MKLCTFQGTFNPIHNAHIRLAEFALERYNFDKILFIPAFNPPHKNCDLTLANHRLEMVKIATKNNPKFEVSEIEYERKGKSYTYLTVCQIYERYEIEGKIHFIIGTDAFEKLPSWYEYNKLKKLLKFIVFIREDNFDISKYNYLKNDDVDFEFQKLPFTDISSTELRNKIKSQSDISLLLPKEERDYIEKYELYRD